MRDQGAARWPQHSTNGAIGSARGTVERPRKQWNISLSSTSPPPFTFLPKTDWNQHALCRFMSEFTMRTNDLKRNPGFLHNLPELHCEASGRDPLLDHAVMAVSLVHQSNQTGSYDAARQARNFYGVSISSKGIVRSNLVSAQSRYLCGVVVGSTIPRGVGNQTRPTLRNEEEFDQQLCRE